MPRKKKLKNMTEEDWEVWGESLGKRIEKKFDKFGKKADSGCCKWEDKLGPANFLGPLIGAFVSIFFLVIVSLILNWVNIFVGSTFIFALTKFILTDLWWLFLGGLLIGYGEYIVKKVKKIKKILYPLVAAINGTFILWILGNIFGSINISAQSNFIGDLASFFILNTINIFIVLVVFAYAIQIVWYFVGEIYL